MTDFPDLKLKALVSFPAAVFGGTGLAVRQENGKFYFDLAYGELAQITSIPNAAEPTTFFALWESTQDTYRRISTTDLKTEFGGGGGGGIPEAPSDGALYGRLNAAWSKALPLAGGTTTGPLILAADPAVALGAATKQYVDANIGGTGAVRYDTVQALTAAQQTQARQNIYAAPFDAMNFNDIQFNGAQEISQQFGTTAVPLTGAGGAGSIVTDGWTALLSGPFNISVQQVADAPPGFTYSLKMTCTLAAAAGTNDYAKLTHKVEGYRIARLAFGSASAQSLSFGFWVKAHRPGTYSVSIMNGPFGRAFSFAYTVNAADTWEYKTQTIPGDVTGTWPVDNTKAMEVGFTVTAGSGAVTAPNVWAAGTTQGATGQTANGLAATSDTFQITGVCMLPGLEAPTAARSALIIRTYDREFQLALRYYRVIGVGAFVNQYLMVGMAFSATIFRAAYPFESPMRASPTVSISAATDFAIDDTATPQAAVSASFNSSPGGLQLQFNTASGLTAARAGFLYAVNINARIRADARF